MDGTQPTSAERRPDFSIVMPTYKRPDYLHRCLKHHVETLTAAGLDFEIIVCDDASGPETDAVVAEWRARDPRIRVIVQPRNVGAHANYLCGIRQARGIVTLNVSDDDLLIPEIVASYKPLFAENPRLVMVQAPWFLLNEKQNNSITGTFYTLPEPVLCARGDHKTCLDVVISRGIFPESYALRTDAIDEIVTPPDEFAYMYFAMLAHAVSAGDVLFSPAPHAIVTAVSKHGDHLGARETAVAWDKFRGGLEYLVSYARGGAPEADWRGVEAHVQAFTLNRMANALRLQIAKQSWFSAWQLLRRLQAYGEKPLAAETVEELASLAAIDAIAREAHMLGATDMVVEDRVYSIVHHAVRGSSGGMEIVPADDWSGERRGRVAFVGMALKRGPQHRDSDLVFDLAAAMRRLAL